MSGVEPNALSRATRASVQGAQQIVFYPSAWLLAYGGSLLVALPVALAMAGALAGAADGYPAPLGRGALNVDWWQRLRQHDAALVAEFVPRTLGFAASLDSLNLLLGNPASRGWPVSLAIALYAACWSALWAVVLTRLSRRRDPGLGRAWAAVQQHFVPMLSISIAAAVAAAALFLTMQPALLRWLDARLTLDAEPGVSLAIRAGLIATFAAMLLGVGVIADVARAHCVLAGERSLGRNLAAAWRLVTQSIGTVLLIALIWLSVHGLLLAGYGAAEVLGGARLGGWRAVLVAQAVIAARLLLRLLWGSAFLSWTQHQRHAAPR